MKRALITGAGGFAGTHLTDLLKTQSDKYDVFGTSRKGQDDHTINVDLLDYDATKKMLAKVKPEIIFHLAAFSSPALSFGQPKDAINDTLNMQINLYEGCLELGLKPRFLVVSSGQIYGKTDEKNLPLTESSAVDFASPYSIAKIGQENLAEYYAKRELESIIVRPFNHIGPGQQKGFLVADLASQIVEAEQNNGGVLAIGNLTSKRDFTDVRDIVRAYQLVVEQGTPGEIYNVCHGQPTSGQQILDTLLRLSSAHIEVKEDPARMRPSDIPNLYGNAAKLTEATGWKPQIPLEETLQNVLEYWRQQ